MTVRDKLLTADEFWAQYADSEARYELRRGEVVEAMTPGSLHSDIAALITAQLVSYVTARDLGRVKVEAHYQLSADTVRVAGVSFVSSERQAQIDDPAKFAPFAPDLVIEIISPSETYAAVRDKINDYRAAGSAVMWLVYPDLREIEARYLQQGRITRFGPDDTLHLEAALPGFTLPLKEIFLD